MAATTPLKATRSAISPGALRTCTYKTTFACSVHLGTRMSRVMTPPVATRNVTLCGVVRTSACRTTCARRVLPVRRTPRATTRPALTRSAIQSSARRTCACKITRAWRASPGRKMRPGTTRPERTRSATPSCAVPTTTCKATNALRVQRSRRCDVQHGSDTSCDEVLCHTNEHVQSHACVACPAGSTNDAGDGAASGDTVCDHTICGANTHVLNHVCVVSSRARPPGRRRRDWCRYIVQCHHVWCEPARAEPRVHGVSCRYDERRGRRRVWRRHAVRSNHLRRITQCDARRAINDAGDDMRLEHCL